MSVLPAGLPSPTAAGDGLDRPYWEGTRAHALVECDSMCAGPLGSPTWASAHATATGTLS